MISKNKTEPVGRIVIEVNNGKVWWVISDANIKATVMNHDEGIIRNIPVDLRNGGYVQDITNLAEQMVDQGLYAEFEKKLEALDPFMYKRLKHVEKQEKERGE